MILDQHSEPVTIHKSDGTPVVLKRVRAEDRHLTFRSEFRTARKLLLIEDLMLCGVPTTEWGKRLEALNSRRL